MQKSFLMVLLLLVTAGAGCFVTDAFTVSVMLVGGAVAAVFEIGRLNMRLDRAENAITDGREFERYERGE